ncbi:MAG: hypothetical protein LUH58_08825 [Lachnospiraceae bacterium]|nr:hypothetical protein [Lachnospiraceae bacterium]
MQKEAEVEHLCPRSLNKEETYDLSHTVKENLQGCRNACKDNHVAERCEDEADYNTILAFCQGYRTNMLGLAANREESQKKQADRNFINAYFNHDEPQEVYPYLDAIVEDLLQTEISKDMFSEEDFRRRGPELKKLRDKMIGLERLKEKYPGYFVDHLPKFKRYTLDAMGWFVPAFDKMMEVNMKKRGVNLSDGEYDSDQVTEEELNGEMLEATYRFNDALKQYEINKEQINLEEVDRRLPELEALQRGDFEQIKRTFEENSGPGQEFEKYEGLRFTNYGYLYQYNDMVDRREMLIKNPQKYAENKELVDRIYNEIYRAMDIGADYYFKSKALSIGMDDMSAYSRGQMDRDLRGVFAKRQEETMDDLEEINHRILGLTDVLQYVLKGKPLTNLGGLTLEQLRNSADYDAGNENEEGGNQ